MKGCKNLPAAMKIDFIRLYQDPHDTSHTVDCSPAGHPTWEFIQAHPGLITVQYCTNVVCVVTQVYCAICNILNFSCVFSVQFYRTLQRLGGSQKEQKCRDKNDFIGKVS